MMEHLDLQAGRYCFVVLPSCCLALNIQCFLGKAWTPLGIFVLGLFIANAVLCVYQICKWIAYAIIAALEVTYIYVAPKMSNGFGRAFKAIITIVRQRIKAMQSSSVLLLGLFIIIVIKCHSLKSKTWSTCQRLYDTWRRASKVQTELTGILHASAGIDNNVQIPFTKLYAPLDELAVAQAMQMLNKSSVLFRDLKQVEQARALALIIKDIQALSTGFGFAYTTNTAFAIASQTVALQLSPDWFDGFPNIRTPHNIDNGTQSPPTRLFAVFITMVFLVSHGFGNLEQPSGVLNREGQEIQSAEDTCMPSPAACNPDVHRTPSTTQTKPQQTPNHTNTKIHKRSIEQDPDDSGFFEAISPTSKSLLAGDA